MPAQELDVHVALIAGQQEPHRIAVAGHQMLAVLIDRDQRVVIGLLDRNAAVEHLPVGALGDQPFRRRIDAGFVEQHRQRHAGPFRIGDEAVQQSRRRLQRLLGEHRRRIAGAFDERHAGDQRVARQRLQREFERLAHLAVNDELVLGRVDVRNAAMIDGEVQAVRRHRAIDELMRRACVRIAKFAFRIAQRPHDVLLERRRCLQRRRDLAECETPRCVAQRLGGGAGHRPGGAHRAGDGDTSSKQCSAIDKAVAGDVIERWRAPSASPLAHDFLPDERRHMRLTHGDILMHGLSGVQIAGRATCCAFALFQGYTRTPARCRRGRTSSQNKALH